MRAEKTQLVKDIGALLDASSHMFLVNYQGLKVSDFRSLRDALAKVGAQCHVVPNPLLRKAAEQRKLPCLDGLPLTADNALITGGTDPVAVARVLRDFAKTHEKMKIRAGALSGVLLGSRQVLDLADLPPKEILQAQLVGVLAAPLRNLVSVLNAKVASIVYVLQACIDKKKTA